MKTQADAVTVTTIPARKPANEAASIRAMARAFAEESEILARFVDEHGAGNAVEGVRAYPQARELLTAADRIGAIADIFLRAATGIVMSYVTVHCGGTEAQFNEKIDGLRAELDADLTPYIASFEAIANGTAE